jgi:MtN3 and saliva related transmembrane protein
MQATFPPERKTFPTSSGPRVAQSPWPILMTSTGPKALIGVGLIPASEDADIRGSPKPTTGVEMIWYIAQMSRANFVEWIGWLSSALLLATLMRQVYTQWRSRSDAGVSRWLFVGQVTASLGFTIYSVLVHNRVYIASNIAILATAIAGELIYLRNRKSANPR